MAQAMTLFYCLMLALNKDQEEDNGSNTGGVTVRPLPCVVWNLSGRTVGECGLHSAAPAGAHHAGQHPRLRHPRLVRPGRWHRQ
eukprot:3024025-Rhodomonas_salina.1